MSRRFKKRRYGKKRSQFSKMKADVKLLKKSIERKFYETPNNSVDVNSTGSSVCLNTIKQGHTVDDRIGNEVTARRLTVRGYFYNNHGTPEDCVIRMLIVRAIDQNNVKQEIGNVLKTINVNSHANSGNRKRFQILSDQTFAMDTSSHSIIPFYFTTKIKSTVIYSNDNGAATDIRTGAYYIMYFSTVSGVTNDPLVSYISRFYYVDA